ncbi:MAG: IS110 family transposase [Verrucomicrobiota bacterium]
MKKKEATLTSDKKVATRLGESIKLGVDVHIDKYVVVMKIDGSAPSRPRSFAPEDFLAWAAELRRKCAALHSCYEAGPFGYGLHRKLQALGVVNYVIRPVSWDSYGKRVKTDGRDAAQMALCLDGYLRGNDRSFSVVRVPSQEEERLRSVTRQRQSLVKERQRLAMKARSHVMYYGGRLKGEWWKPRRWKALQESLEDHLTALLEPLRTLILAIGEQIDAVEKRMAEMKSPPLPRGMGLVTCQQIEREIGDWSRFDSGRKVGSYAGLCPREDASGERRFQGSISKHGNPRLRTLLVECAWLLLKWNPGYAGIRKWRDKLLDDKLTKASGKKIVVAIARRFAVDWWKVRTGRIAAEDLGLIMKSS